MYELFLEMREKDKEEANLIYEGISESPTTRIERNGRVGRIFNEKGIRTNSIYIICNNRIFDGLLIM